MGRGHEFERQGKMKIEICCGVILESIPIDHFTGSAVDVLKRIFFTFTREIRLIWTGDIK